MKNFLKINDRIAFPLAVIVGALILSEWSSYSYNEKLLMVILGIIAIPGIIKSAIIWVKSIRVNIKIDWINK